jgi:hypothetical protein
VFTGAECCVLCGFLMKVMINIRCGQLKQCHVDGLPKSWEGATTDRVCTTIRQWKQHWVRHAGKPNCLENRLVALLLTPRTAVVRAIRMCLLWKYCC